MDAVSFTFSTTGFVDDETALAEDVNGLGGKSLAVWLADELRGTGFAASEPWAEDHGWDFTVTAEGARYVVVCTRAGSADEEAAVHVHRHSTFLDRLRGRGAIDREASVLKHIEALLRGSIEVSGLKIS